MALKIKTVGLKTLLKKDAIKFNVMYMSPIQTSMMVSFLPSRFVQVLDDCQSCITHSIQYLLLKVSATDVHAIAT
jgi:hypothetical protein